MKTSSPGKTGSLRNRLMLAAFGFSLALTASGQDLGTDFSFPRPLTQTTQFGISPLFGYRWGGEIQDADTGAEYSFKDAPAYGLILDYAPMDYFGRFELLWSRQDTSVDFHGDNGLGNVDITIDVFQVGSMVEYGSESLRGYASAHVGATHFSSDGFGDDTKFSFDIGAGVKAFLTKNIYLRADLRGIWTVTEGEGGFIFANGVTVAYFSGSTFWQGQVSAGIGITF
jgi:opacity protein-like surface antigen